MVILATVATIIASQAAITGSFSVAKQAVQLGFLPRLKILHTSKLEGQIYVPLINWVLCIGVVALVLVFQNSGRLADIYGVAVTGTFILNTMLFLAVARALWRTAKLEAGAPRRAVPDRRGRVLQPRTSRRSSHGAWLSLAVGLVIADRDDHLAQGREIVTRNRTATGGPARRVPRRAAGRRAADPRVPGIADLPQPGQGDDAAGAARRGRAHPRAARQGA